MLNSRRCVPHEGDPNCGRYRNDGLLVVRVTLRHHVRWASCPQEVGRQDGIQVRHLTHHTVLSNTSPTKHLLFSCSMALLSSQQACGPPYRHRTYIVEDGIERRNIACVPIDSTGAINRLNFAPAHESNTITIVENIVHSLRCVV